MVKAESNYQEFVMDNITQTLVKADEYSMLGVGRLNDIRVIGICTLIAVLVLAIVGMDWVTRVQLGLLGKPA